MQPRPIVFFQAKPTQFDAPLFRALTHLGADVRVVYGRVNQPVDAELGIAPVFAGDLDGYRWGTTRENLPPNAHIVVSGWADRAAWRNLMAGRFSKRTVGVRFDTVDEGRAVTTIAGRLRRARQALALTNADVWHPVGDASRRYAEQVVPKHARPSLEIPYAIDVAALREGMPAPTRSTSTQLNVLVVAKLADREGVDVVIRALENRSDLRLTVVGDGPNRLALQELASNLGVHATFAGYVPFADLALFYAAADVFVHAANAEPWGVSVQEAMGTGLPVLATSVVGSARALIPGDATQWSFEPGDHRRLARLLVGLQSPSVREAAGQQNRAAATAITPQKTAQALLEFLCDQV